MNSPIIKYPHKVEANIHTTPNQPPDTMENPTTSLKYPQDRHKNTNTTKIHVNNSPTADGIATTSKGTSHTTNTTTTRTTKLTHTAHPAKPSPTVPKL